MRDERADLVGGRYRLVERIGVGGSSDVWRAHDHRRDRAVTLKLLREPCDPADRRSFLREVRILDAIRHRGTIPVLATQDEPGATLIAFEHLDADPLSEVLRRRGGMSAREVGLIVLQLGAVLGALHRRGYAHLDVKPANVLLAPDGRVRLIDLGIAERIGERPCIVRGTRRYVAPEIVAGATAAVTADVYAMGVLALDLLGPGGEERACAAAARRASDPRPWRRPRSAPSFASAFAALALLDGEIGFVRRICASVDRRIRVSA